MGKLEELAKAVADRTVTPPDDPEVEQSCPFLWEMLTKSKWGDDSERILPRVVIERISGGYKVILQDDSLCIRKEAFCKTLAECPQALEKALNDDETPWETFKSYRNRGGPKVPEAKKGGRQRRT
jgi:hypothetical protein